MAGATIVFCDIVGFSQHNNDEQRALIYSLNAEVTHELYAHLSDVRSSPAVIGLPTGDGMAIALMDKDQGSWASELFSLLDRLIRWAKHNGKLRIGVHTGPVSVIADINRRPNICGASINDAQRVMDAAHPNQVLFSADAYRVIVGPHSGSYCGQPFSEQVPARFKGPFNIIAKHGLTIPVYIMYRHDDPTWVLIEPYPRGTILGKLPRTQFIANQLDRLTKRSELNLCIYEQAAFSTFGISEDQQVWRASPEYSEEYFRASIRQRQLLDHLAREERTTLKLIIHPVRAYEPPRMYERLNTLLKWMSEPAILTNDRIDFVKARYDGPNRIIVQEEFSIEGFKLHDTSGYELSMVHQDGQRIAEAISSFDRVFREAREEGSTKQTVIADLETLCDTYAAKCPTRRTPRPQGKKRRTTTRKGD